MNIHDILTNRWVKASAVSVVSAAAGAAGGYFVGKKKARIHVHITREKSIFDKDHPERSMKEIFDEVTTNETKTTVTTTVEEFEIVGEEEEFTPVNVFTNDDGDWDMEAELGTRGDGKIPYILHQEEFINDEMDFHQSTVTYYSGDNIMVDTDDTIIYNHESLMGPLRFGHGSKDPSVVYIRNETIMQEWEVMLVTGFYAQEVLGLEMEKKAEDELKHSVYKFRGD